MRFTSLARVTGLLVAVSVATASGAQPARALPAARIMSQPTPEANASGTGGATGPGISRWITPLRPYRTIARGRTNGIQWSLLRTRGSGATTCFRVDTKPKARLTQSNGPAGAVCLPALGEWIDPAETAEVLGWSKPKSPVGVVAYRAPVGAKAARVGYVGGRVERIAIEDGGYVVAAARSIPLWIGFRLANGQTVNCAAGPIIDRSDITDPALVAQAIGAIWACL